MALHSGLVWLADGFEKYEKLTTTPVNTANVSEAGDVSNCPPNVSHKLKFSNKEVETLSNRRPSRLTSQQSRRTKGLTRPQSAKSIRISTMTTGNKGRVRRSRGNLTITAPVDHTPRVGAWTAESNKGHQGHVDSQSQYSDMPTHPDLRYFDRHSRCYNNPHCGEALMSSRPRTACPAGRVSLTQCECCGEVTSMIRYQYAPTGSAMTEMNSSNKTFLYPERLLSYDSYNGRRRPSSAPGRAVSITYLYYTHSTLYCLKGIYWIRPFYIDITNAFNEQLPTFYKVCCLDVFTYENSFKECHSTLSTSTLW